MRTTISLLFVSSGINYGLTDITGCEAFVNQKPLQVVNRNSPFRKNEVKLFENGASDAPKNKSRSRRSFQSKEQLREILKNQLATIEELSYSQKYEESGRTVQSFEDLQIPFLESNIFRTLRYCQNVTEIRNVLLDVVQSAKKILLADFVPLEARSTDDLSEPHLDDVPLLGPNIAAYALKEVVVLLDKKSSHHNHPKLSIHTSSANEEETRIARELISILMKSFGTIMDEEHITRIAKQEKSEKSPETQSISSTQETEEIIFSFANLIKSLSKVNGEMSVTDSRVSEKGPGKRPIVSTQETEKETFSFAAFIMKSLSKLMGGMSESGNDSIVPPIPDRDDKKSGTTSVYPTILRSSISPYSYINMLASLAKLSRMGNNISNKIISTSDSTNKSKFQPFARKICERMMDEFDNPQSDDTGALKSITSVRPGQLIELLSALATLNLVNETELLSVLEDRLVCGDVVGKLTGRQLSLGLWSYARLSYPRKRLLKAFTRRLRKVKVRKHLTKYDICRALWAVAQSVKALSTSSKEENNIDRDLADKERLTVLRDSETMIYTLSGELLQEDSKGISKIDHLSFVQLADILSSLSVFDFDNERILSRLIDRMCQNDVLSEANGKGITRILASLQRLHLKDQSEIVSTLIDRFVTVVERDLEETCDPKTLAIILRSAVMLSAVKGSSQETLKVLSSQLLSNASYLSKCNEYELSNFVWYMAMSNHYDKQILRKVTKRMKEKDIILSCSTSSASRSLRSLTKIVETDHVDLEMRERLYEMFQCLGGNLIKDPLSPLDSSSAMWAMAKSSYSLDMNIFDHLAEELASENSLKRAKVRYISEGLWACGKMISWEDPLREKIEYGDFNPPPYTDSAKTFASFLIQFSDQLSPKDIAQAIWAIGRLKIEDSSIIDPMATIAKETAEKQMFNSQEIANIIWGLSKVRFDDAISIQVFTKQLKHPSILKQCTPQEASNVMYALGLMNIDDEDTFALMNNVLMNQINDATTQTIANALWAHEVVNLQPPQLLFNQWAKEKLDITGLCLGNE
jgi:hypothetical protein